MKCLCRDLTEEATGVMIDRTLLIRRFGDLLDSVSEVALACGCSIPIILRAMP